MIISINDDGTSGPSEWEVNNYCIRCGRGIRSWFHGQGAVCCLCSSLKKLGEMTTIKKLIIAGQDDPETKKFKIIIEEIQPAAVIYCADIDKRKFYYIHLLEGSSDPPPGIIVYDELDEQLPGVVLVVLQYNNVSKHGRATITYAEGTLELVVLRTEPWILKKNSNGKNSQSSTMDTSAS